MGFIEEYIQQRRRKKLEEVNRELEQLKSMHPFDPGALKPKNNYNTYAADHALRNHQNAPKGRLFPLLFAGSLFLIILISVFFYYQGQITTLQDSYNEKVNELSQSQRKIDDINELLEDAKHELRKKTAAEFNLSDQSDQLKREKQLLEQEIADLEKEIISKEANLLNLNTTLSQKSAEIKSWKACINNVFNEDPDDCNITSS